MKADPLTSVFISYSHADKDILNNLKRHFSALKGRVEFWDDSKILAGMKWRDEITTALKKAKVAILLISADFLNSTFIVDNELPYLLEASNNGTVILNVILKPCMFNLYPDISKFQAINDPSKTIIQMTEAEQETVWTDLISRIHELIS